MHHRAPLSLHLTTSTYDYFAYVLFLCLFRFDPFATTEENS